MSKEAYFKLWTSLMNILGKFAADINADMELVMSIVCSCLSGMEHLLSFDCAHNIIEAACLITFCEDLLCYVLTDFCG